MTSPILVTGGTGTLGRHVVRLLSEAGQDVRVLSRHAHKARDGVEYVIGDLMQDEGVDAAVDDASVIVHCAGSQKGDEVGTANLVRAASTAGKPHLVYISVIGADRIPVVSGIDRMMFGYFASKRAAELVVSGSGLPWTTLRASQFYDLMLTVAEALAKLPVIPVPRGFRFQPVDAGEVAERLAALALDSPAGLVPDMAGPRIYDTADLIREYLAARHLNRRIVPVPVPGQAAGACRAGAVIDPDR
ncbi:MAG TPA: NAD(P)H-binding protein, partial [Streptosporangiaceae bacterium]